jgi:hypothetical protein
MMSVAKTQRFTDHCQCKKVKVNAYWGSGGYRSTHSLTSALDGGECSVSRPGHFTPGERTLGTHWMEGLGGTQSHSERGGEEKNSQPPPEIEP